ncbi:MAG: pyridoxamine 5'-phosphate oxidase [Thiotrichales bacterium]
MSKRDLRQMRRDYRRGELRRAALDPDPILQFARWFQEAEHPDAVDPTAMFLATATAEGEPALRTVLLKHFDHDGFCWYTDKRSDKGQQLAANPRAELLFYWPELARQVRISGSVVDLPVTEAEDYFHARPVDSRFSAATSEQSAVIAERAVLETRLAQLQFEYPDGNVPRPAAWGGYRLEPRRFEFWQGRPNRLHDRFRYRLVDAVWEIERLSP